MTPTEKTATVLERGMLAAVAALPIEERAAFLEAQCAGRGDMRTRIEQWLDQHETSGFMQCNSASPLGEAAGDTIGPYQLCGQIAAGGFGMVWEAQQLEPVRRRVALKILKLGMDTREVVARFEQERQALALMDHPHIARVFDAGAALSGRPYFVMELVRGVKITDYCEREQLGIEERLRVFIVVCRAVQHAHQKGIIHRDLKPSNILVTLHDGASTPKVIDFGIAKVIAGERLTEATLATRGEQVLGTPLYMSPEQVVPGAVDIDTRSDIYSLGVLLYELLTGRTPVERETLERAGLEEVRRLIREQEPVRPSHAVWQSGVAKRLQSDLDWIVMKALEKDRTRRYETANGLALDLERHLAHEPVLARPPSAGYRIGRMMRRHRVSFAAGVAVLLAVLGGGALATVSFFKEKAGRERAVAAEQRAEREAAAARHALADLKASAPTVLELAESEARLQRFASAQAKLEAALALDPDLHAARWRRAWVFIGQEKFSEAADAMRAAGEQDRRTHGFDAIRTLLDEIAAAPVAERWSGNRGSRLLAHLDRVGASGESVVLARRLQLGFSEKLQLVKARLAQWLGADGQRCVKEYDAAGEIEADLNRTGITTLEPLRGLPLTRLRASFTKIASLEPLRGMPLSTLWIEHTQVADLSPLDGMPVRTLRIAHTRVRDLSPLRGLPLEDLTCYETAIEDLSPLRGTPLKSVAISGLFLPDLAFLADSPIEWLNAHANEITDLSPLRGKSLRWLAISRNQVSDLSPLRGAPIEGLQIHGNPLSDLTPLLDLPKLERITVSRWRKSLEVLRGHPTLKKIGYENEGFRSVADFWAEYDAEQRGARK